MEYSVLSRTALLLFLLGGVGTYADANERSDWFKSLKIPGTKASCCDIADCRAAEAAWRDGRWWVLLDDRWRPVPEARIVARPTSIDGAAYVCLGPATWSVGGTSPPEAHIHCFIPPNWPT
jgi:hypothetical protein